MKRMPDTEASLNTFLKVPLVQWTRGRTVGRGTALHVGRYRVRSPVVSLELSLA